MESHIKLREEGDLNTDIDRLNMDSNSLSSLGEKCLSIENINFHRNHQQGEEPELTFITSFKKSTLSIHSEKVEDTGSLIDEYEEVEVDKDGPEVPGNLIPTPKVLGRSLYLDRLTFPSKSSSGNWVQVPRELIFSESYCYGSFEAKIRIFNPSKWTVSYCVCSSTLKNLKIKQKVGCISPQGNTEILVFADLAVVKDFAGFCRDMLVVLATPICFESQTQAKKINLLWKVFGTNAFPYTSAEAHKIDRILPRYNHYLGKTNSMLSMASLGNYTSLKDNVKEVVFPLERNVDEFDFYDNWCPTEPDHEISVCLKRQILDWHASLRSLKHRIKSVRTHVSAFNCLIGTTAFLFIAPSIWTYGFELMSIIPQYGSNGQPLNGQIPKEQASWWFQRIFN